jgi:hypothetical protein
MNKITQWDLSRELLTPEEREIALDDMKERLGSDNPSLEDCVYIGAVYQQEKSVIYHVATTGKPYYK